MLLFRFVTVTVALLTLGSATAGAGSGNAPEQSGRQPHGTLVPELSNERTTTVSLGDGRLVSRLYAAPVNRPDGIGGWEPIPLAESTKRCYPRPVENWTGAVKLQSSSYEKLSGLIQFTGRRPSSRPRYQGWAKFNLAQIPDGATVDTVLLCYYCNAVGGDFPSTYLHYLTSDPVTALAQALWDEIRDGVEVAAPSTHGLYWQYRPLNAVGVAYVQACLARDWIAFGLWEFHEQNNNDAYGSAYGYASGEWTPYLEIKYAMPLQTDISAEEVLEPVGNVNENTVVTPTARWRNRQPHPDNYTAWFIFISPGGQRTIRSINVVGHTGISDTVLYFPPFNVGTDTGRWTAKCSTYAAGDIDTANNIIERFFRVVRPGAPPTNIDVQALQILAPALWIDTGTTVTPSARYRNLTSIAADFIAQFFLTDPLGTRVYSQSITVAGLGPGRDTTIDFPPRSVGQLVGNWNARCTLIALNDTNPANNWLDQPFVVYAGRPPWSPGWHEVRPMPLQPSGKGVKDGGWLTFDPMTGVFYAAKGSKVGDFYSYNPATDSWKVLASWKEGAEGKGPAKGSVGIADGHGHVYATKGSNSLGFWCYHIDGDTWQQLRDVSQGRSGKKVKGGTDIAYIEEGGFSYVYLLKGHKTDFMRYAVSGDSWTWLPDAPTGIYRKWDKGSWMVFDNAHSLYAHKSKRHEFWRFDLATAEWDTHQLKPMPYLSRTGRNKKAKDGSAGAFDNAYIYALKGGNTNQFFRYVVNGDTWTELDTMPSVGSTGKKKVKGGGDISRYDMRHFFALKGSKTLETWYYYEPPTLIPEPEPRAGAMAGPALPPARTASAGIVRAGPVSISLGTDYSGPARIVLFDVTGSVVLGRQAQVRSGMLRVDLTGLRAGIYLVRIRTDQACVTRKLILGP